VSLRRAQLSMLLGGINWPRPARTQAPEMAMDAGLAEEHARPGPGGKRLAIG
jgi:hypothetical protein